MYNLHAHALISGKVIIHNHELVDNYIGDKTNPDQHTAKDCLSIDKITSFFFVDSPILLINSNIEFINKSKVVLIIRSHSKAFFNNIFLRGPPQA